MIQIKYSKLNSIKKNHTCIIFKKKTVFLETDIEKHKNIPASLTKHEIVIFYFCKKRTYFSVGKGRRSVIRARAAPGVSSLIIEQERSGPGKNDFICARSRQGRRVPYDPLERIQFRQKNP